jgi:hypothetical protein
VATIVMDSTSTISVGGIDLTPYVTAISFEPEPEPDPWADQRIGPMPSFTLRFRGELEPVTYRTLFRRNHPRIRRMHSAYRQRRRGKW